MDVDAVGLPAFTIAVGLLDGFNPCALWVLLFILSILAGLRDRRRMALVGGRSCWWLALVAIGIGAINVKDFFLFRQGVTLGIPDSARPGVYRRMRGVRAERALAAVAAAAALAVVVNVVELLCTAGLPALYTQILSLRALPAGSYYGYLAPYNLAYIADDAVLLLIATMTLGSAACSSAERAGSSS